jgi:hypothetical protein
MSLAVFFYSAPCHISRRFGRPKLHVFFRENLPAILLPEPNSLLSGSNDRTQRGRVPCGRSGHGTRHASTPPITLHVCTTRPGLTAYPPPCDSKTLPLPCPALGFAPPRRAAPRRAAAVVAMGSSLPPKEANLFKVIVVSTPHPRSTSPPPS